MIGVNPLLSFVRTLGYVLTGRLHFSRERVGEVLTTEDGGRFVVFRQAVVDPSREQPEMPGAVFRVRFHLTHMSPEVNRWFSLLPIPFFVGLPGFRSKLCSVDERIDDFMGVYEWDTVEDAENYAHSFAMRFMVRRSIPGSLSYEMIQWMSPV